MSHQNPVLRNLRSDLATLRSQKKQKKLPGRDQGCHLVTDSSPHLAPFCRSLEAAFQHGLLHKVHEEESDIGEKEKGERVKGEGENGGGCDEPNYFAVIEALARKGT